MKSCLFLPLSESDPTLATRQKYCQDPKDPAWGPAAKWTRQCGCQRWTQNLSSLFLRVPVRPALSARCSSSYLSKVSLPSWAGCSVLHSPPPHILRAALAWWLGLELPLAQVLLLHYSPWCLLGRFWRLHFLSIFPSTLAQLWQRRPSCKASPRACAPTPLLCEGMEVQMRKVE